MATPIDFEGSNRVFRAPTGMEHEVGDMPALRHGRMVISCWRFTEQELKEILESGVAYLTVICDIPTPSHVGSLSTTLALVEQEREPQ